MNKINIDNYKNIKIGDIIFVPEYPNLKGSPVEDFNVIGKKDDWLVLWMWDTNDFGRIKRKSFLKESTIKKISKEDCEEYNISESWIGRNMMKINSVDFKW